MAASTVYDVRVNLSLADKLTPGVRRQTGALAAMQREARGATSTIDRLAKAAAFGFGMKSAYGWLVKYNAEVDDLKRKLSTIIMLNTGGDWNRAFGMASDLTFKLREDAKLSAGTMQDMVSFAAAIANPVLAAGGNMEQLRDFTRQAVVAAAALGERADLAQLDITQALQGTLTQRDRFARALLAPMGFNPESFNKLSGKQRFDTLLKGLNDPAIKAAAKSYEKSFSGVTSTLKDNLQQLGGTIGTQLFSAITTEVIKINSFFVKNKREVAEFASKAAQTLGEAFTAAKRAVGFLVEHRELIMALAKAYLIGKGVSILTGPLAGLGRLAQAAGLAGGALAALPGILSVVAVAATGIADLAESRQRKQMSTDATATNLLDQARDFQKGGPRTKAERERAAMLGYGATDAGVKMLEANSFIRRAREMGIMGKDGRANKDRIRELSFSATTSDPVGMAKQLQAAVAEAQTYAVVVAENERRRLFFNTVQRSGLTMSQYLLRATAQAGLHMVSPLLTILGMNPKNGLNKIRQPKPPAPKIDKLVIEVHSDDPDRFHMGIQGFFQDWARNPSHPPTTLREGR